jgi:hypothetical protein
MVNMDRKQADGLFLSTGRKVAEEYPDIQFNDILLDRACLHVSSREMVNEVDGSKA